MPLNHQVLARSIGTSLLMACCVLQAAEKQESKPLSLEIPYSVTAARFRPALVVQQEECVEKRICGRLPNYSGYTLDRDSSFEGNATIRRGVDVKVLRCWYKASGNSASGSSYQFWKDSPPPLSEDDIKYIAKIYYVAVNNDRRYDYLNNMVDRQVDSCPFRFEDADALRIDADRAIARVNAERARAEEEASQRATIRRVMRGSAKQRLEDLEDLRKKGLVSQKEYQQKKAEILKEL